MYEDKPSNLSLRDFLVKVIAKKMSLDENVIDEVITHQFKNLFAHLNDFNKVEVSGFGRFYFNGKKARKKLQFLNESLQKMKDNPEKYENEINKTQIVITELNKKIWTSM